MTKVTIDVARRELYSISKFYPTLAGLMAKPVKDGSNQKFGTVWTKTIVEASLNVDHFCNVCDEYASGSINMPDPSDRLCREIIKETRRRTSEEQRRLEQFQKYHNKKNAGAIMKSVRDDGLYGWYSIELGRMLRDKQLTQEEHDEKFNQIRDYDRGGELPDWARHDKVIRENNSI